MGCCIKGGQVNAKTASSFPLFLCDIHLAGMRFTLTTSIVALAVLAAAAPQPAGKGTGVAIPITKRSNLVNPDKSVNFDALNSHVTSVNAYVVCTVTGTSHSFQRLFLVRFIVVSRIMKRTLGRRTLPL